MGHPGSWQFLKSSSRSEEDRTSAAKAAECVDFYGTAKAVPFLRGSFVFRIAQQTKLRLAPQFKFLSRRRGLQGLKPDGFLRIYGPTKVVP